MTPGDLSALKNSAAGMAARLKLMGHPERLLMLCRMSEGEVSVNGLVGLTGLAQSAVSQHLALLREAGVVSIRKDAQSRLYALKDKTVRDVIDALCRNCA